MRKTYQFPYRFDLSLSVVGSLRRFLCVLLWSLRTMPVLCPGTSGAHSGPLWENFCFRASLFSQLPSPARQRSSGQHKHFCFYGTGRPVAVSSRLVPRTTLSQRLTRFTWRTGAFMHFFFLSTSRIRLNTNVTVMGSEISSRFFSEGGAGVVTANSHMIQPDFTVWFHMPWPYLCQVCVEINMGDTILTMRQSLHCQKCAPSSHKYSLVW